MIDIDPTPSQRRQYAEARAVVYRLRAKECQATAIEHRCCYYEAAALNEERAQVSLVYVGQALSQAETYDALAVAAEAEAVIAKNEEIKLDYYSGPPGSYTGD